MLQFKFSIVASVRGGLPPQILVGFFFKRPQKKLLRKKMLQKNQLGPACEPQLTSCHYDFFGSLIQASVKDSLSYFSKWE
jgi:hypothetical protein